MRVPPFLIATALLAVTPTFGATPQSLLDGYRATAGAQPFSAARGRALYDQRGADWSCSSCHTADPRRSGRHAVTGKSIQPLAPAADPQRFTDPAKVEKWFRRNCRDVLERECTAREKGDFITWLAGLPAKE
jgi:hypothetical protein